MTEQYYIQIAVMFHGLHFCPNQHTVHFKGTLKKKNLATFA